jgi:hypothetical protein
MLLGVESQFDIHESPKYPSTSRSLLKESRGMNELWILIAIPRDARCEHRLFRMPVNRRGSGDGIAYR